MSDSPADKGRTLFGIKPIKALFAAEYVLQGLANPFQGITYQPFFRHFRNHYGLEEAAVQGLFARSYLAWSFKPVIGFFVDAIGHTRTTLLVLLSLATGFFLFAPALDFGVEMFFWTMFLASVVMACTDVVVDRATVVEGDEESRATGRSKAATIGLNQAICWIAIYGTSIVAAVAGGYVAEHFEVGLLLPCLALAPFLVLLIAWRLPKEKIKAIPLRQSVRNFWDGLNTGPVLWIVAFYFLFHFQPQAGALWNNYMIETLKFSQSQIGLSDGAGYVGYFVGTLAFARWGIRWQDRYGLRRLFKVFIPLSAAIFLTQFLMLEPTFSRNAGALAKLLPFVDPESVRLGILAAYSFAFYVVNGFIRMCTFSLVGVIIPAAAAGSLFAGFMSVANVGYSFSYASGSWLYANGMNWAPVRAAQLALFGIPGQAGDDLSMHMLLLVGAGAYLLNYVAVHRLPDRRETLESGDVSETMVGPKHFEALGTPFLRRVNGVTVAAMAGTFAVAYFGAGLDPIAAALLSFFGIAFVRKVFLDNRYEALMRQAREA